MVNCNRCEYKDADNGNCTAVGGFCTAVQAAHCFLLTKYLDARLTPGEVHSLWGEWNAMMSVLNSIGSYDRLRELAQADRDGRVVVLPCKVGDTVYVIDKGKSVRAKTVYEITCKQNKSGKYFGWGVCLGPGNCGTVARYRLDNLGRSWFLTREEAEKALEKMGNG